MIRVEAARVASRLRDDLGANRSRSATLLRGCICREAFRLRGRGMGSRQLLPYQVPGGENEGLQLAFAPLQLDQLELPPGVFPGELLQRRRELLELRFAVLDRSAQPFLLLLELVAKALDTE